MSAKFRGHLFFLSNMSAAPIKVGEYTFTSSETLFQVCKSTNPDIVKMAALKKWTGFDAKGYFRRHREIREDWHDIKLAVMWAVIKLKFTQNPELRDKLLETHDSELIELNTWHDTYWGVDARTGEGMNYMGRLLRAYKYIELDLELPDDCEFVLDLDLPDDCGLVLDLAQS